MSFTIEKIHHVAYRCKDAKETVEWYQKNLNMDFVLAFAEDYVPSTKAYDPYMHVFLDAGNGNVLAFFELPNQPQMGADPNTPDWVQHLAGPGIPDEAGITKEVIKTYAGKKPIFGVCLGLQAITEVFGGTIINLDTVYHGVATVMNVTDKSAVLFKDVPVTFLAARYHSWSATKEGFPDALRITATDEDGGIQAIEHKVFPISAVQFHPESILTDVGEQIVANFINSVKKQ